MSERKSSASNKVVTDTNVRLHQPIYEANAAIARMARDAIMNHQRKNVLQHFLDAAATDCVKDFSSEQLDAINDKLSGESAEQLKIALATRLKWWLSEQAKKKE